MQYFLIPNTLLNVKVKVKVNVKVKVLVLVFWRIFERKF
jgi:hypothetical protein